MHAYDAKSQQFKESFISIQEDILRKSYTIEGPIGKQIQNHVIKKFEEFQNTINNNLHVNKNEIVHQVFREFKDLSDKIEEFQSRDINTQRENLDKLFPLAPNEAWAEKVKAIANNIKTYGSSIVKIGKLEKLLAEGNAAGFLNQDIITFAHSPILIFFAKKEGFENIIPLFSKTNVDLCAKDYFGNTALIWAIANASNGTARRILQIWGKGNYIDEEGSQGNTALHMAVGKGYKNISAEGQELACSNLDLVHDLISFDCNVNKQNTHRDTPLHFACIRRDIAMIKALLEAGAKTDICNENNKTPAELLYCNQEEAEKYLKERVYIFTLDKNERDANVNDAMDLFLNKN